jgi:hypothetical protein
LDFPQILRICTQIKVFFHQILLNILSSVVILKIANISACYTLDYYTSILEHTYSPVRVILLELGDKITENKIKMLRDKGLSHSKI